MISWTLSASEADIILHVLRRHPEVPLADALARDLTKLVQKDRAPLADPHDYEPGG